ncbi:hypothetical protein CYMTET_21465 [Cymbomonas tetramitiformis]|uniref:Uncharacterized protein n=1 Tax=Cymbomonas tetramitiformis TaxID=36881 RepID=A0AAE0L389_9CHLO|nr:hypothetical protein CYMTET_21465 [Cymbomonas tetramitiformis]
MAPVILVPGSLGEAVALLESVDMKLEKADSLGHRKLAHICYALRGVVSFYQDSHAADVGVSPVPGVDALTETDFSDDPPVNNNDNTIYVGVKCEALGKS